MANRTRFAALLFWVLPLAAQPQTDLARIMERLERLEQENRQLQEKVKTLEARLDGVPEQRPGAESAPAAPVTVEQKISLNEAHIDELYQTKVESSQKLPIRITGMALVNAFLNSRQSGGADYPAVAGPTGARRSGATVRQSIVGLEYRGASTVWGGNVHGSIYMDFGFNNNNPTPRIRTASIEMDWKSRSFLIGVEKPIFNPREPSSLAQVSISPLTGSGNLWLWLPQARFEQDVVLARNTGLRAQVGLLQTREVNAANGPTATLEGARPAVEGRFEFYHNLDDERRLELAPGFHRSTTHANGLSVNSSVFSMDWGLSPVRRMDLTGAFYTGTNVAPLGAGYAQGFVAGDRRLTAVHSTGGWSQLTIKAARRVDFHLMAGMQDDQDGDLFAGRIGKNLQWGGNVYYRLAPNVLLGVEATQLRTWYIAQALRINNHYDVALAYLF